MITLKRCLFGAVAVTIILSTGTVLAVGSSNEMHSGEISVTATLESVACMHCFRWKGTGGAERVADNLIVTVSSPAQFAGKRIKMFVWDDGGDTSQPWQPGSRLSFFAPEEEMGRERVILPHSHLLFTSK